MERIGHPATWPTTCFIDSGCGTSVFGHTNGYGDFVLFDDLGWPWPIHGCYARRFEISHSKSEALTDISRSRGYTLPIVSHTWDTVQDVPPNLMPRGTSINILGTVTDLKKNIAMTHLFHRPEERTEVLRRLDGRKDIIDVVDGRTGLKFTAFVDLLHVPVQIYDTVAAQLKSIDLYLSLQRRPVVIVTKIRVYRGDGKVE